MKTIEQKFLDLLESHGLWPEEAQAVMEIVMPFAEFHSVRFSDPAEGSYPPAFYAAAWLTIKAKAIEYLEKHKPQHFALAEELADEKIEFEKV